MKNLNNALAKLLVDFKPTAKEPVKIRRRRVVSKLKLPDQVIELTRKFGCANKTMLPTRTVIVRDGKWFTPSGFELRKFYVLKDYAVVGAEPEPKIGLVETSTPRPLRSSWPSLDRIERDARLNPTMLKGGSRNLS